MAALVSALLGMCALKGPLATPVVECSSKGTSLYNAIYHRAIDASAKNERLTRVRSNHEMPNVNRPGDASGLVRAFEVALDAGAILFELKILGRG
jgi:hypothetical protein